MKDCILCLKHREKAAPSFEYEGFAIVHESATPEKGAYRGYFMVECLRHVKSASELTREEAAAFGFLYAQISRFLEVQLSAAHVYLFRIGDIVPHLHFHVIPRYAGTPDAHRGWALRDWPDAPRANEQETQKLLKDLQLFVSKT